MGHLASDLLLQDQKKMMHINIAHRGSWDFLVIHETRFIVRSLSKHKSSDSQLISLLGPTHLCMTFGHTIALQYLGAIFLLFKFSSLTWEHTFLSLVCLCYCFISSAIGHGIIWATATRLVTLQAVPINVCPACPLFLPSSSTPAFSYVPFSFRRM